MVNSWIITYSNKLLPINNHMFDHMTNHWYLDDQIRKILLLWYRKLQKHVPFLRVGNYSMPDFHFFSQRVFRRPFAELHLGGFQVEPKDLIDLRGQFPGGCDDGGPHHELQAARAAAHALRQGAAHDLESGDQEGQGLPWARAGLAIRLIGPWWPWEKPLENTEIWGTNCWASCSDGIWGTNFELSHIFLTKKRGPGKSPSQTNTARLHRDVSLLQQQGDGDGLHWRHPLEAHLRNEALCALQRHEV